MEFLTNSGWSPVMIGVGALFVFIVVAGIFPQLIRLVIILAVVGGIGMAAYFYLGVGKSMVKEGNEFIDSTYKKIDEAKNVVKKVSEKREEMLKELDKHVNDD